MTSSAIKYEMPGLELLDNSALFVACLIQDRLSLSMDGDWRGQKLREFVDNHEQGDRCGITQACKEVGLSISVRQARRLFKASVGVSFITYSRFRRLIFAARRLEVSDAPVKVIALELGYGRAAEFTRSFKELFLLSPLEFRRVWGRRACAA